MNNEESLSAKRLESWTKQVDEWYSIRTKLEQEIHELTETATHNYNQIDEVNTWLINNGLLVTPWAESATVNAVARNVIESINILEKKVNFFESLVQRANCGEITGDEIIHILVGLTKE